MRAMVVLIVLLLVPGLRAENIRVATYNVENWNQHFEGFRQSQANKDPTPEQKEQILDRRGKDDEDNWEVAETILDKDCSPDVIVFQECCAQKDLEFFNRRWLNNAYKTVLVFPTNTDRNQHLGIMLKEGFSIVQRKDEYHQEKDSVQKPATDKLFARGPAFAMIQAPSGYRFWLGTTHQKSKSDDSLEVTQWRNREAVRTHQIIKELEKTGLADVMFLGDMNDDLGKSKFEEQAGQDTIEALVGPADDGMTLLTEKLAKSGTLSYHGYWKTRYRGFLDHVVITKDMKDQIQDVRVFTGSLAKVASDHYPVIVEFKADTVPAK